MKIAIVIKSKFFKEKENMKKLFWICSLTIMIWFLPVIGYAESKGIGDICVNNVGARLIQACQQNTCKVVRKGRTVSFDSIEGGPTIKLYCRAYTPHAYPYFEYMQQVTLHPFNTLQLSVEYKTVDCKLKEFSIIPGQCNPK